MPSNLRSEIRDLVYKAIFGEGIAMLEAKKENYHNAELLTDKILALAKSKMPKMKPDPLSGHIADIEAAAYNKCLAEVISILRGSNEN